MSNLVKSSLSLQAWTTQDLLNCKVTAEGGLVRGGERLPGRHSEEKSGLGLRSLTVKETAHLRAAYYWLNHYQPNSSESPSEQIQGLLEAAHDFRELQAWKSMSEILLCKPNPSSLKPLHEQLDDWGLLHEQVSLYQPLVGKVSPALDSLCLHGLGRTYKYLGQYLQAIEFYKGSLQIAQSSNNYSAQAKTLEGLGFCYLDWGKHKIAERYFLKQLSLSKKAQLSDSVAWKPQEGQARALAGLGNAMFFLRQFQKGIRYSQRSLELSQKMLDVRSQWMALGAMAICYSQQGKYQKALACLEKRLALSRDGINPHNQLTGLIDLGATYCYQFNFDAAIAYLEEAVTKAERLSDTRNQCQALKMLGFVYGWQNKHLLSIERSQQSLRLAEQFRFEQFESQSCSQLSYVYSSLGETDKAIFYAKQALQASERVKPENALYKACGLMALGLAKVESGEIGSGAQSIATSFITLPPWTAADSKIIFAAFLRRVLQWLKLASTTVP